VDAPIIRGFRKRDWVGVGLVVFSDKAGILGLTHTAAKLGASYHLALNKKGTTYLTLGAQYGQASRRLNPDKARFAEGFLNKGGSDYNQNLDVDFANLNRDQSSWTDIDGGLVLKSRLNKQMDFSIGYAMYHIDRGQYGLITGGGGGGTGGGPQQSSDEIARRSVATGQFNIKMNDKLTVSPTFIYQTMAGAHDEIIVQGLGSYLFNEEKDVTLLFGLGYRFRDAVHPIFGAQIKSLRVGLAYDVNISGLSADTNLRGGFELAANYIIKIYKPAVVKTKVLCPRF
ncbi:MAG: PorP/SprF family type IX secretion system membrane protein, partial [Bacteroidota bacterium]